MLCLILYFFDRNITLFRFGTVAQVKINMFFFPSGKAICFPAKHGCMKRSLAENCVGYDMIGNSFCLL